MPYDKFEVLLKQFVCRFWFQSQSQDTSGGNGYTNGGGGGGGRVALYYVYDFFVGTFKSAGGTGGSGGENGGPGTIYVHKLPVENEDLSKFVSNRTLFIDNHNRAPNDPLRNLTDFYNDFTLGSAVAWIIPSDYPDFVFDLDLEWPSVPYDKFEVLLK